MLGGTTRRLINFIFYQSNKLRVKLFITYFIIIIFLTTGIGAFSYTFSSRSVEEKLKMYNLEIIDQINKNLESNFLRAKSIMLIPYNNSDYIADMNVFVEMDDFERVRFQSKMSDYFLRSFYTIRKNDLENFFLYSDIGKMFYSSTGKLSDVEPPQFDKLSWVQKAIKKNGDIYFGDVRNETVLGREKLVYSTAIMIKDVSLDNKFSIAKADFNFDEITKICTNKVVGKRSQILLVDEDKNLIFNTGDAVDKSSMDISINSKIKGDSGTFWTKTPNGEYMVSYGKSNISGWEIISLIPKDEIFDASIQIRTTTIIISIIALLLTAVISFIFSLKISKPLTKLDKMIDSVKKGDLSIRMKEEGGDEIGRIYTTFNALIEEVNSLIENKYIYQIKEREYELNLLYAQINPHFLYNTLDTIRGMADIQKAHDVAEMINLLADMFRYSVKNINIPTTVREELFHLKGYLTICSIRFGNKIDFCIDVADEIMDFRIPRLIMQPIVENSIRHGRTGAKNRLSINVIGNMLDRHIHFNIKDDGSGMSDEILLKVRDTIESSNIDEFNYIDSHIGLRNISNRLRLHYGEGEYIQVYSSEHHGTVIEIKLPIDSGNM